MPANRKPHGYARFHVPVKRPEEFGRLSGYMRRRGRGRRRRRDGYANNEPRSPRQSSNRSAVTVDETQQGQPLHMKSKNACQFSLSSFRTVMANLLHRAFPTVNRFGA